MNTEKPEQFDIEEERQVESIVSKLKRREWWDVLMNESIGGNAGENRAGINAFADKKTGELIIFGNIQDLPKRITSSPEYEGVTLLYNLGNAFVRALKPDKPLIPAYFEDVFFDKFNGGMTDQAKKNLEEAIRRYNEIYKQEQEAEETQIKSRT